MLTLSQTTIFRLLQSADDNFRFDLNDRKFCEREENTLEKRQIAHYEPFLLFPQCLLETCTGHVKARACLGNGEVLFLCITFGNVIIGKCLIKFHKIFKKKRKKKI